MGSCVCGRRRGGCGQERCFISFCIVVPSTIVVIVSVAIIVVVASVWIGLGEREVGTPFEGCSECFTYKELTAQKFTKISHKADVSFAVRQS